MHRAALKAVVAEGTRSNATYPDKLPRKDKSMVQILTSSEPLISLFGAFSG